MLEAQFLEDLVVFGEAPRRVLREEQLGVSVDVEDPVAAADQLGLDADLVADPGRQTGGPGEVVSTSAVVDRDLHVGALVVLARF